MISPNLGHYISDCKIFDIFLRFCGILWGTPVFLILPKQNLLHKFAAHLPKIILFFNICYICSIYTWFQVDFKVDFKTRKEVEQDLNLKILYYSNKWVTSGCIFDFKSCQSMLSDSYFSFKITFSLLSLNQLTTNHF